MGWGYGFECKKCKKEYSFHLGVGMMMPRVFERTIDEVNEGAWGEECKKVLNSERFVVPDIEKELYICKSCGRWSVEQNMNMYAPNNPETILHQKYGIKTVEEWGKIPYVMRWQLEKDYHRIKSWIHICECGKRLHKASKAEMENLACPYCGTINTMKDYINWD